MMITTQITFSVSGNSYDDLLAKCKLYLSQFFDVAEDEVLKKINLEIQVKDQTDSLDFEQEDEFSANVLAQVTNV